MEQVGLKELKTSEHLTSDSSQVSVMSRQLYVMGQPDTGTDKVQEKKNFQ